MSSCSWIGKRSILKTAPKDPVLARCLWAPVEHYHEPAIVHTVTREASLNPERLMARLHTQEGSQVEVAETLAMPYAITSQ